jgi:peptidyl-prolyl cis-trans isomerase SurA
MRSVLVLFFCFLIQLAVFSQNNENETFITIEGENITKEDFERVFNKNNNISTSEKQSVEEYLRMFINFRIKVHAAIDAGYDTTSSFLNELKGYRDQLARTYLTDNSAVDSLILEAYQRMHTEVNASHIMAAININATPADTLAAWNKIMAIRDRLLKGEDFELLARELSDDPSAKSNQGNLGYFTAFQMVYPFESAAYNGKIGDISMPVRSRFGYHLVKTMDKRPANGEVKVAHIMLMVPQGSPDSAWISAENKIRDLEKELKAGADFATLARERSEDRGSARNGGELPAFGAGRMVPEFEATAFKLQSPGEISAPVRTFYGWHIIKLIEKKGVPEFDQIKQELKTRISRDERAEYGSNSFVAGLKSAYGFSENEQLLSVFYTKKIDPVSYVSAKQAPSKSTRKSNTPLKPFETAVIVKYNQLNRNIEPALTEQELFRFADQKYTLKDFTEYMNSMPPADTSILAEEFVLKTKSAFVKKKMLEYEDSQLELKYPDFRYLVQEYHDGILLFNLSDSLVWSKASKDTIGLQSFFIKNQANYFWPDRLDATVVTGYTDTVIQKAQKIARKLKSADKIKSTLISSICDTTATEPCLNLLHGKFVKGENPVIDSVAWKKGFSKIMFIQGAKHFVVVHDLLKPSPKTLDESRGIAISDYQNELDRMWVNSLRNRYQIIVNQEILNQLIKKYAGKN